MIEDFKFTDEDLLIRKILFSEKKLIENDFKNICYESFVKIASSHLILPTIYIKLKNLNKLKFIPPDLKIYLS